MGESSGPVTVVIPARYGSSRFPGKPLARLLGKPLIQHVYERVTAAPRVDRVVVATDDPRIRDAVADFGGTAVLHDQPFRTGTDRVAAVAREAPGDVFVNLQGDEIPLHAELVTDLILPFLGSGAPMGTLKRRLTSEAELASPGAVKVVVDERGDALFFSRAPIPFVRDGAPGRLVPGLHFIHLGLYIYARATLLRLAELPTTPLEAAESLEQLRALEHGIPIRVWETRRRSLRVDTPDDLAQAEAVLRRVATGDLASTIT